MSFSDLFMGMGLSGAASAVTPTPTFNIGTPEQNQMAQNIFQSATSQGMDQNSAAQLAFTQTMQAYGANNMQVSTPEGGTSILGQALNWLNTDPSTIAAGLFAGAQTGKTGQVATAIGQGAGSKGKMDFISEYAGRGTVILLGLILVAGALYLFGSGTLSSGLTSAISSIQERNMNLADAGSSVKRLVHK